MKQDDFELGPLADVARGIGEDTATVIFARMLRHPPEKVWRALTEPAEQLEWLPFVADRTLDDLGPAKLRMTDGSKDTEMMEAEVLQSERARLLSFRWGDELLTWELTPQGTGTLLILRHKTRTPEHLSSFAAGWHICIAVAERFMDGRPIGRVVGQKALQFGWAKLNEQYQQKLQTPQNSNTLRHELLQDVSQAAKTCSVGNTIAGIKHHWRTATCRCGTVRLDVKGEPILTAICYCTSCQAAGRQFATLAAAPAILTADGGTPSVLYRKDRVQCVQGGERLKEYRLTSGSPTRRMMATCCNTPLFLDFTKGFWLTIYQGRLSGDVPQPKMRVMTAERPKGVVLPDDLPHCAGHSGKFMWRLLRAWVLMGLRRPKVAGIPP